MLLNALILVLIRAIDGTIEDHNYWMNLARNDIENSINPVINNGIAKNVILFVGDGMGPTTVTAARIYSKTEKGFLSFEKFPNIGVLKTYSANKLVADSCSTATALFCGVKANQETAGVDASVQRDDCAASLKESARLDSVIKWAQDAGKSTGFVTTTRVTHATPSALYAHSANRRWECEGTMPRDESFRCKDIAKQLIEDLPGRNIQVIMGGGRQCLVSDVNNSKSDPIDTWSCYSKDGRDLIRDWQREKSKRNLKHQVVQNNRELQQLDFDNVDYLLGIFANGHLKMDFDRNRGPEGMPSLENMTEVAIKLLRKNHKGFVLIVEGGMIDFAHHRGHARQALDETSSFSRAIEKSLDLMQDFLDETLIVVTSDHAHSMVFTGYADRYKNILGVAEKSKIDQIPYTSLLYGTGGPNNYQFLLENSTVIRPDPTLQDTTDFQYSQQAAVLTDEVKHSGTDVLVYATGPMSHLFHSVHEQTYVAYTVSYAAKIGPFRELNRSTASSISGLRLYIVILMAVLNKLL